jgi:hypothetical protein
MNNPDIRQTGNDTGIVTGHYMGDRVSLSTGETSQGGFTVVFRQIEVDGLKENSPYQNDALVEAVNTSRIR